MRLLPINLWEGVGIVTFRPTHLSMDDGIGNGHSNTDISNFCMDALLLIGIFLDYVASRCFTKAAWNSLASFAVRGIMW